ncbi:MAG TPA: GNAT family protein [Methylibium sp.]
MAMHPDPLLIDVPTRLDTPRLVLRCPQPGDGAAYHEAIVASQDELRRWMPWAHEPSSEPKYEAYARRAQAEFLSRCDLAMAIFLRQPDGGEGPLIGASGLHRMDWAVRSFEIGYWCHTGYGGQGYISEAVHAITTMAFETLAARRVEIRMDNRNERSRKLAERCGFELEGVLRCDCLDANFELRDTRVYSRVRRDPVL